MAVKSRASPPLNAECQWMELPGRIAASLRTRPHDHTEIGVLGLKITGGASPRPVIYNLVRGTGRWASWPNHYALPCPVPQSPTAAQGRLRPPVPYAPSHRQAQGAGRMERSGRDAWAFQSSQPLVGPAAQVHRLGKAEEKPTSLSHKARTGGFLQIQYGQFPILTVTISGLWGRHRASRRTGASPVQNPQSLVGSQIADLTRNPSPLICPQTAESLTSNLPPNRGIFHL